MINFTCQVLKQPIASEEQFRESCLNMSPKIEDVKQKQAFTKQKPTILQSPLIPILVGYLGKEVGVSLQFKIYLKNDKLQFRICEEMKAGNYMYKLILVENCECYSNLLTLQTKIKYEQVNENNQITNFQDLTSLVSNKNINIHSQKAVKIRKSVIIIEPIQTFYTYHSNEGYMLVKLDNSERTGKDIIILDFKVMNQLCVSNAEFSKCIVKSTLSSQIKLAPEQCYAIVLQMLKNMKKLQIPYSITYKFPQVRNQVFKMIKYMKI